MFLHLNKPDQQHYSRNRNQTILMKTILPTLLLFLISVPVFSQDTASLVREGIQLYDNGQYTEAIDVYQKALVADPNSSLVHYELALTFMATGEYGKAEEHSRIVLKQDKEHQLEAYVALGNALDMQGKAKKAIKVYEKGIKKYDHYLLHYNHAIACFNNGNTNVAYDSALNAISNNSGHASSHLILSKIMDRKNSRIQAMLPLYFFLLIEPNTERAAIEYQVLRNYLDHGVVRENDKKINITVPVGNDDFGAAEMMVSLVKSSENLEENRGKSQLDLFAMHNEKIFNILGELKDGNTGFWWDFYVPFFYDLSQEGYVETYSHYISLSQGDTSIEWLQANEDSLESFTEWVGRKRPKMK